MKIIKTAIEGLLIIQPDIYKDDRGYFYESFSERKYTELGGVKFVQDNVSKSTKDTIRGLHYQVGENAQGKLCSVLLGKVLDVAVDVRQGSPTFGQHVSVELSDESKKQFWLPPGFAHGFSVLSDEAIFTYKCTGYYSKEDERCIIYNDTDLKINWKVNNPILSEKDLLGQKFRDIQKHFQVD